MAVPSAPGPLIRFAIFLLAGGLALVLATLGMLKHLKSERDLAAPTAGAGVAVRSKAAGSPTVGKVSGMTAAAMPAVDPAVGRLVRTISAALAVLRDPHNPNKSAALTALREALAHTDPAVALAAIRQFLATGEDAVTGQRFKVGPGGVLAEAPTLRTFLMDQLGTISRAAGTGDAAEEARATLQAGTSPDESAVAMRNLAWADPEGSKPLLAASERALLTHTAWRQSPTGGYLEAFDVAAYVEDPSLLDQLAPMAADDASPVQRAALVAMERLSAMAPAQVAGYLNTHPGLLSDLPLLRADYMGNVDLADPAQRAAAETYLARTDVTDAEKDKFIARLATPAGFVSDNLLTPPEIPVSLPAHAAAVNQVAGEWLASGRYPAQSTALQAAATMTAAMPGPAGSP